MRSPSLKSESEIYLNNWLSLKSNMQKRKNNEKEQIFDFKNPKPLFDENDLEQK